MSIDEDVFADFQIKPPGSVARVDPCKRLRIGHRMGIAKVFALLVLFGCATSAFAAASGNGVVDGRMCVRPVNRDDKAGDCGAVEVAMLSSNRVVVRVSDIVYRLELHASQIDVVMMHGTMQIDGFSTNYDWQGRRLNFSDPDKGMRYEIDFDPKARRAVR